MSSEVETSLDFWGDIARDASTSLGMTKSGRMDAPTLDFLRELRIKTLRKSMERSLLCLLYAVLSAGLVLLVTSCAEDPRFSGNFISTFRLIGPPVRQTQMFFSLPIDYIMGFTAGSNTRQRVSLHIVFHMPPDSYRPVSGP